MRGFSDDEEDAIWASYFNYFNQAIAYFDMQLIIKSG